MDVEDIDLRNAIVQLKNEALSTFEQADKQSTLQPGKIYKSYYRFVCISKRYVTRLLELINKLLISICKKLSGTNITVKSLKSSLGNAVGDEMYSFLTDLRGHSGELFIDHVENFLRNKYKKLKFQEESVEYLAKIVEAIAHDTIHQSISNIFVPDNEDKILYLRNLDRVIDSDPELKRIN